MLIALFIVYCVEREDNNNHYRVNNQLTLSFKYSYFNYL